MSYNKIAVFVFLFHYRIVLFVDEERGFEKILKLSSLFASPVAYR